MQRIVFFWTDDSARKKLADQKTKPSARNNNESEPGYVILDQWWNCNNSL